METLFGLMYTCRAQDRLRHLTHRTRTANREILDTLYAAKADSSRGPAQSGCVDRAARFDEVETKAPDPLLSCRPWPRNRAQTTGSCWAAGCSCAGRQSKPEPNGQLTKAEPEPILGPCTRGGSRRRTWSCRTAPCDRGRACPCQRSRRAALPQTWRHRHSERSFGRLGRLHTTPPYDHERRNDRRESPPVCRRRCAR